MRFARVITLAFLTALLVPGCGSDDDPLAPDTQNVSEYLAALPTWEEFSPLLQSNDEANDYPIGEIHWDGDQIYVCRKTPCSITETPEAIATFDPSTEILWLGSLIQGRTYLGGIADMEELPIRQRAPLTIALQLINDDVHRTIEDPTMATVNQAIGELVTSAEDSGYEPSSTMSFNKHECYSLKQGMLKMGMSASYMGVSVSAKLELSQTFEQTSVVAYFRQRMFTVSLVLPQTPSEFFSEDFTVADMKAQESLGRIGPDNLPTFVSSITYGRILVMTMTSTYSETEMKAALQASYDGIVDINASISTEQREVLENSTINIVAVGGEASGVLDLIRTGTLGNYFLNEVSLTSAVPISYTIRNLADNSLALVSETTDYDILKCSTDAVVYYNDYDLWHNAVLQLRNYREDLQGVGPAEITDCDEHGVTPDNNANMGYTLTFPGTSTGLSLDFTFNSPNGPITYNDNEFPSAYYPCLSPGDADNYGEDDDIEITVTRVDPGYNLLAMGIWVGHSDRENGETLRIYGESNIFLQEFTSGILPLGDQFMGVVSAVPLTRIYYNEKAGGDDIVVWDFYFGLSAD